jgi:hypothetical protein
MISQGPKLDKTAFSVGTVTETSDEKAYWLTRTPQERLAALEWMRQVNYGYDPATDRLQRVLTITDLKTED